MGKCCICLNVTCWLCITLAVAAIISFYIFVLESSKSDPGFCTRQHASMAVACAKKDDELGAAAASLNDTEVLLLPPVEYEHLAELCHVTLECAREIKCKAIRKILNDLSICGFIYYYTKEFKDCANKLYEKRNEISCLSEIYNPKDRTSKESCSDWKSITPCVKESIKTVCDDKLGILQYKWENKAQKANSIYCEADRVVTLGSHENVEELHNHEAHHP